MLVKGCVTNNTGRSRHIFKRTVYPGQSVPLHEIHAVVRGSVPEGADFVAWLEQYLPSGWELDVVTVEAADYAGGRMYKETLTAVPVVEKSAEVAVDIASPNMEYNVEEEEDNSPSKEYSTPRMIDKMTAKDIFNLRLRDNPKRILKHITSIHKLRRALTFCKTDSRKATLSRLIQGRIRELNVTL